MIELVVTVSLFALGWWIGSAREQSHLQDLKERERALSSVQLLTVRNPPADWSDAGVILQSYVDRVVLPAAELAVHGVMTDESLLDAVLAYREERNDHDSD